MKKVGILIVSMILCCLLLAGFVACKDPSGNTPSGELPSGEKDVNEIKEFTEIMTVVIGEFADKAKSSSVITQLATADANVSEGTISRDTVEGAFEYLDEVESKTEEPMYEQMVSNLAVKNLISVLAYAQAFSEIHDTDKIYDVPMRIEPKTETVDGAEVKYSGGYAIIKSDKSRKVLYFYDKDDEHSTEVLYKYEVNYKSKDDFFAKMAMVGMDEITLNTQVDKASAYYFYGDANDRVLFMMGGWGNELASNFVAYKSEKNAPVYLVDSTEDVNACFNGVKNDFTSIDLQLVRSLKSGSEKSISWDQYMAAAEKLAEEFGIEL